MTGDGRFSTTYTFGAGQASSFQPFWFRIFVVADGVISIFAE